MKYLLYINKNTFTKRYLYILSENFLIFRFFNYFKHCSPVPIIINKFINYNFIIVHNTLLKYTYTLYAK